MSQGNEITQQTIQMWEDNDKCLSCGGDKGVIHKGQIKNYCSKDCRNKRVIIRKKVSIKNV